MLTTAPPCKPASLNLNLTDSTQLHVFVLCASLMNALKYNYIVPAGAELTIVTFPFLKIRAVEKAGCWYLIPSSFA